MLYLTTVLDFFLHYTEMGSNIDKNLKGKGRGRADDPQKP
jgi:hypothetical protein